jgi:hypothetical protein
MALSASSLLTLHGAAVGGGGVQMSVRAAKQCDHRVAESKLAYHVFSCIYPACNLCCTYAAAVPTFAISAFCQVNHCCDCAICICGKGVVVCPVLGHLTDIQRCLYFILVQCALHGMPCRVEASGKVAASEHCDCGLSCCGVLVHLSL